MSPHAFIVCLYILFSLSVFYCRFYGPWVWNKRIHSFIHSFSNRLTTKPQSKILTTPICSLLRRMFCRFVRSLPVSSVSPAGRDRPTDTWWQQTNWRLCDHADKQASQFAWLCCSTNEVYKSSSTISVKFEIYQLNVTPPLTFLTRRCVK